MEKALPLNKLIISEELESKIRFLCNKFQSNEWSGVLFYEASGSLENNDLSLVAKDLLLMDIGSASYTEFDESVDIAAYLVDNLDLINCHTGLIHSHHSMATFFSGTDISTLNSEGKSMNHFLSLIVNNSGIYTAKITVNKTIEKTISSESYSYKSFNDEEVVVQQGGYFNKVNIIEHVDLNVIMPNLFNNSELENRINELNANKITPASSKFAPSTTPSKTLFKDEDYNSLSFSSKIYDEHPYIDQLDILRAMSILLTGNIHSDLNEEDLNFFVKYTMQDSINTSILQDDCLNDFYDYLIELVLHSIVYSDDVVADLDGKLAAVASALIIELSEFEPNSVIEHIILQLETYVQWDA